MNGLDGVMREWVVYLILLLNWVKYETDVPTKLKLA